jgi:GNAT superfamily N-acetyltransferase
MVERIGNLTEVEPLFSGWEDTLVRSALEGCVGEVYASADRRAAQIVYGDFAFLAGDAACDEAAALATHLPQGYGGDALLLSARDAAWLTVSQAAWGDRAVPGQRFAFRKDAHRFDPLKLRGYAHALPPGIRLAPLDGALYRRALAADWSRDFVSLFRDEADFVARGLGVIALDGEEPVAGASSYAVFSGGIEVEIDTREDYRRRGLARACGAALILACLDRGLFPSWDAANPASAALAEQLGYIPAGAYPILIVTPHICPPRR